MGNSELQNQFSPIQDQLFSEATRVLDRPSHSNRETGAIRVSTHETHSVALEEPLAYPRVVGEDHPDSQVPSSSLTLVVEGRKCPAWPAPAPPSSRCSDL